MIKVLICLGGLWLAAMHISNLVVSLGVLKRDPVFFERHPKYKGCLVGWRSHNVTMAVSALLGAVVVWWNPLWGLCLVLVPIAVYALAGVGLLVMGRWPEYWRSIQNARRIAKEKDRNRRP